MSRERPGQYEWWIDEIQDCLAQISGQFESINPASCAHEHVCDETYVELPHFVETVIANRYCDVPTAVWSQILVLAASEELEADVSKAKAAACLADSYFKNRERWKYGRATRDS